jgi:uncharacterized membrane protein YvlD (DUF360 family)
MSKPEAAPHSAEPSRNSTPRELLAWVLHLALYSVLLIGYFLFVLRYLSDWFTDLFHHHRVEFALFGILAMIFQAVVLDAISAFILRCFHLAGK